MTLTYYLIFATDIQKPMTPSPSKSTHRTTEAANDAHRTRRQNSTAIFASPLTISSTFNSLFKVLFTFPSRYLFAISLVVIFSFGWNLPPFGALIPKYATRCVKTVRIVYREMDGAVTLLGAPFQKTFSRNCSGSPLDHNSPNED